MKAMAVLPALAAALLALGISAASGQKACMKDFQACMDHCTTKPSKAMQDSCFHACEGKNDVCAEKVYGKRPANAAPAAAAAETKEPPAQALAKSDKPQAADARDEADPKQIPQKIERRTPAKR